MSTVDSIVKGLSKIHDQLRQHVAERTEAAADHRAEASAHIEASRTHDAEANRARQIADNLSKLLGT